MSDKKEIQIYLDPWVGKFYELCYLTDVYAHLSLLGGDSKILLRVRSSIFRSSWHRFKIIEC